MTSFPVTAARAEDLEPSERHAGLIFDWDGTLADSQDANFSAVAQALREHGVELERAWFDAHGGVSTREMVVLAAESRGVDLDATAVRRPADEVYLTRVHEVVEVAPVAAVLRREHGRRRLALATGNTVRPVTAMARALGLLDFFDVVITREDVAHGKPAPDSSAPPPPASGSNPPGAWFTRTPTRASRRHTGPGWTPSSPGPAYGAATCSRRGTGGWTTRRNSAQSSGSAGRPG